MTQVTRATACLAAAGVTVGLLGAPGRAEPTPAEPGAPHERSSYGSTHAPDGVLRKGCRGYAYRYTVTPPTGDWTLETFLRDPTGDSVASGAFMSDSDPATRRSTFDLCRYNTRPGRFTIRALLHWYDDEGGHRVWLEPSRFRLRRAR
ncbi:hypothetical protein [Nocardioides soli]|uniref:Uncharacterized protein n=1 Tax=Nocardioides soli TaxID=1036020 RepID=A0A7W4VYE9_9ACTN|nr:hypothetical protein [Nocardioides soli]MBB3044064.1 hypothetical protein [Nocardioides soli]